MKYLHLSQTDSTNNLLRNLISDSQAENLTCVTADFQTSGRGQIGNAWESEEGRNLLMSVAIFPKKLDIHRHFFLSMAMSIAIVESVENQGVRLKAPVAKIKLKWPNDIYFADKKLGGILIENNINSGVISSSIVGLGLNINQEKFISDAPNPISLKNILNVDLDVKMMGEKIVENMGKWLKTLDNCDYNEIKRRYLAYLYRFDRNFYRFLDENGEFLAKIVDVEDDGHLVLEDNQNRARKYLFKEVSYLL